MMTRRSHLEVVKKILQFILSQKSLCSMIAIYDMCRYVVILFSKDSFQKANDVLPLRYTSIKLRTEKFIPVNVILSHSFAVIQIGISED